MTLKDERKKQGLTMRGVGGPGWKLLNLFGSLVWDAFGQLPYLVGSATQSKDWHDVDVRLILDDVVYDAAFGKPRNPDDKRAALELAFSILGEHVTGLPIDFQIQQQTYANEHYNGVRDALGIEEKRFTSAAEPAGERTVAGSLAIQIIQERLRSGRDVEIPSLGIVIKGEPASEGE